MAYKVFTNGSVLNASEVNDNLMNQAVITFTNSTARSSAITSPVEGMLTYLEDTDTYEFWDGAAWAALVSSTVGSGNAIINGAFEINQRNFTSTTTSGDFGFDRWLTYMADGTTTYSSQAFTLGAAPVAGYEAANFARLVTTGQTLASASSWLRQKIESVRSFAGQTVTVSFWAKAATGTPKVAVELSQIFGPGGSGASAVVNTYAGQVTLSTSWARYEVSVAVPSISGKTITSADALTLNLMVSAGTDFDARSGSLGIQSNTFDIWGVQVEAGSTATPFRRNANSLQGELAACQRYYFRTNALKESTFGTYAFGFAYNTSATTLLSYLPVTMRTKPTSVEFSSAAKVASGSLEATFSGLTIDTNASTSTVAVIGTTGSSGLTQNHPYWLRGQADATSFIGFSAEL